MKKKLLIIFIAVTMAMMLFGGCSMMEDFLGEDSAEEVLLNGTTTGNILNYGLAVKDGDDLIFTYTQQGAYERGSIVRTNVDTGESSLLLEEGGLYMNVVGGDLYYCRDEGVYKLPLTGGEPSLVLEQEVAQLQIRDGKMYYISSGNIGCAALDGGDAEFEAVENAGCLNVYGDTLYYIDMKSGNIFKADIFGGNREVVYKQSVDMFFIIDDVIYFIDSADGYIKRMLLSLEGLETVVAYSCSGFNVNNHGLYYTRDVNGQSLCCNAGADGYQETVITEFGESVWHAVCMFGDGAVVVVQEEILALE